MTQLLPRCSLIPASRPRSLAPAPLSPEPDHRLGGSAQPSVQGHVELNAETADALSAGPEEHHRASGASDPRLPAEHLLRVAGP
ncbi:hypothetical protein H920_15175 [Fukomys damarensis]|uniref:Uncharacterized protein n=1 Tax=Fukomys damarensis TaxID=885580 RepID=A0A091CZQ2_FUKDA|nr:hypothetical protein H920_15175 [Fukomys damarensis]